MKTVFFIAILIIMPMAKASELAGEGVLHFSKEECHVDIVSAELLKNFEDAEEDDEIAILGCDEALVAEAYDLAHREFEILEKE